MTEAIICGVVAAVASIIVAAIQNNSTKKLIEYQISELKKEVEKHNTVVERTFILEKETAVIENTVKSAHHRIDDLEKRVSSNEKKNA